jgi:REP element-mobilizing transposase RayT
MSHSFNHNPVHLVFSTKERRKTIVKGSQPRLWAYMAGLCKNHRIFVHEIGGMEDHVHMLIEIPLTLAFADAIREVKTGSSQWMGPRFAWQRGFGIFGVSDSNVNAVVRYIRNQEGHHRKRTYEQEFIALLEKHRVSYDPRYVFG